MIYFSPLSIIIPSLLEENFSWFPWKPVSLNWFNVRDAQLVWCPNLFGDDQFLSLLPYGQYRGNKPTLLTAAVNNSAPGGSHPQQSCNAARLFITTDHILLNHMCIGQRPNQICSISPTLYSHFVYSLPDKTICTSKPQAYQYFK